MKMKVFVRKKQAYNHCQYVSGKLDGNGKLAAGKRIFVPVFIQGSDTSALGVLYDVASDRV